ncbi:MAG: APC family permease [Nitrososphaerota archaeon]
MTEQQEIELKREIGWFGSFAMGYGDVGADIFIALGIVTLYAAGAMPIAFLVAALVYIAIGLAYGELAPAYPYAGGVHVYSLRGLNTLVSFIAGWALMLDYVLDISLFSVASAGYLKFIFPQLVENLNIKIQSIHINGLGIIAGMLVALLIILNYFGIKYSSGFISLLVFMGIAIQGIILITGFVLKFNIETFIEQIKIIGNSIRFSEVEYFDFLTVPTNNFLYGLTLAMASFIGIESIAQAAEETKRPYKWIPRAVKLSVLMVIIFVISFSILATGSLSWETLADAVENPIAAMVKNFPIIGTSLSSFVAIAAFVLCLASSNTGVIGASRLVASMGKFSLLPRWLFKIHPIFRTPSRTILLFGTIGLLLCLPGDIPFLASLYNFGALLGYIILMLSLIILRIKDSNVYRPWKIPINIRINHRGKSLEIPVLGIIGLGSTSILWGLVILLHPMARIAGFLWLGAGLCIYILYRKFIKKSIIDNKTGSELVVPHAYKMEIILLVRPFEEIEIVKKSILENLDTRFVIRLLSVIDLTQFKDKAEIDELEHIREQTENDLMNLAKELRAAGYEVSTSVKIGELVKIVEAEAIKNKVDGVAYIKRLVEKASIEKGPEYELSRSLLKKKIPTFVIKRTI